MGPPDSIDELDPVEPPFGGADGEHAFAKRHVRSMIAHTYMDQIRPRRVQLLADAIDDPELRDTLLPVLFANFEDLSPPERAVIFEAYAFHSLLMTLLERFGFAPFTREERQCLVRDEKFLYVLEHEMHPAAFLDLSPEERAIIFDRHSFHINLMLIIERDGFGHFSDEERQRLITDEKFAYILNREMQETAVQTLPVRERIELINNVHVQETMDIILCCLLKDIRQLTAYEIGWALTRPDLREQIIEAATDAFLQSFNALREAQTLQEYYEHRHWMLHFSTIPGIREAIAGNLGGGEAQFQKMLQLCLAPSTGGVTGMAPFLSEDGHREDR